MNRTSLRPLASLLVLCFMLVSVVSRSTGSAGVDSSACTVHVPTSHASAKRVLQLITEEKEGEKGSEKSAAIHAVLHTFTCHAALFRSSDNGRTVTVHPLCAPIPLYLIYRSLIV